MPHDANETPPTHLEAKTSEASSTHDLENEKLKLEVRLLARQLSKRWLALEWLKSATVLVGLLGVGVTLYIGFGQVRQSEQTRSAERLDKAIARLASDKPNERLAGVSALRLFLAERDVSLRSQTLQFLVGTVSVESDQLVQTAILDTFRQLKGDEVDKTALNASLLVAVERNRSLANSVREQTNEKVAEDQKQRIAKYQRLKLRADEIPTPIPQSLLAKLTLPEYLDLLQDERGPFEGLDPKVSVPLGGLAQLITTLLERGAKHNDFSDIYCRGCDFTRSGDLSGVKFERAYLAFADFSHLLLKNASFERANLSETRFFAADLSNANLTNNSGPFDSSIGFPLFECANLKGADISGIPLLIYREYFSTTWLGDFATGGIAPRMMGAQIDSSTKLDSFYIISLTDVSDTYLLKHRGDKRFAALTSDREDLPENPIVDNLGMTPTYRRFKADFTAAEADYTSTLNIQYIRIDKKALSKLRPAIKSSLSGYLNQPSLVGIPLLSDFNNALAQSNDQAHWRKPGAYTCNDAGSPEARKLKVDTGLHSPTSPEIE